MRGLASVAISLVLVNDNALAQTAEEAPAPVAPTTTSPLLDEVDEKEWSFSLTALTYIVPDDREYVQPTFTADRDWLHLEARYNYEALNTASAWIGYNFSGGDKLAWEITPMIGGVFGDTDGVAPGYKGSLSWWKMELYSEGELLIDLDNSDDSFFYNWSELTFSPVDWFRFGLVTQRTRVYETDRDIQRGLMLGVSWKNVDLAAYVLDPDDEQATYIISFGVSF